MHEFKVVSEEISGDVCVATDTQFNSINANRMIILENVRVRLYGTVIDVILKKGAQLYLHGKIHGRVQNEGGEVFTFYA